MSEAARPSSDYKESLGWLFRTQLFGIKLGLENIERLLRALHLPAPSQRVIPVAGTNGKGSVCAMVAAICRAQGYRTGLFTSPHLVTFRERIQVDGAMIGESEVAAGLDTIRALVRAWEPHPTFFEIATALALQHFAHLRCEIVVLETGMGGRLDATNAVPPIVSVITPIDLDHQKWLGHTLAEIAGEKAGIIKRGVPVVSAPQRPEAEAVIRQQAAGCDAPLEFTHLPDPAFATNLAGAHQQQNAALAVAALRVGKILVSERAITEGLADVTWPARFQRWDDRIIIDGAHNPAGAQVLAKTWREQFGADRANILLAVLRDKDLAGIVEALAPIASSFILPKARSERAVPPGEVAILIERVTTCLPITTAESVRDAIDQAVSNSGRVLITGSLHFAGEALATLQGRSDDLDDCLQ